MRGEHSNSSINVVLRHGRRSRFCYCHLSCHCCCRCCCGCRCLYLISSVNHCAGKKTWWVGGGVNGFMYGLCVCVCVCEWVCGWITKNYRNVKRSVAKQKVVGKQLEIVEERANVEEEIMKKDRQTSSVGACSRCCFQLYSCVYKESRNKGNRSRNKKNLREDW